jgi:hypothetical protein
LIPWVVWSAPPIHLRTRDLDPPAYRGGRIAPRRHYLLRFDSPPTPRLREQLAQRGIRTLQYVPDNALMVSTGTSADLDGLPVTWAGVLEPDDKLSPQLSDGAAYLVIFHPDTDSAAARAIIDASPFAILERTGLLPGQFLVTGSYDRLPELARADAVAYVLPASPALISGDPVVGCAGPMTEQGPLAPYVEAGNGWPHDGGHTYLNYAFESLTPKIEENAARNEIARALLEWSRYASIDFSLTDEPGADRTIAIRFASRAHGDAYAFDGPGGVLAHTFYPAPPNAEPVAGNMHFDADENWHVGSNIDLFSVALHEAGHALGLAHSDRPGSVMYPYYRLAAGLSDDDIAGIRNLYGTGGTVPRQPQQPTPSNPPVTPAQPPATPSQPSAPPSTPSGPDKLAPALRILAPALTIIQTTHVSIDVSGTASDNVAVTSVLWSTSTGSSGQASGTSNWSAGVPLVVGNNVITIRAYDAAGNSGWRSITVVRR